MNFMAGPLQELDDLSPHIAANKVCHNSISLEIQILSDTHGLRRLRYSSAVCMAISVLCGFAKATEQIWLYLAVVYLNV